MFFNSNFFRNSTTESNILSLFEKYRHDEYCQLVEKCCYALGAIGTEEAKEKLKLLAKSDKDIIREHVEDTFEMYKLS